MSSRALRASFVVAGLAVLALAVQPAFADTKLSKSGTVGHNSLNDTSSSPGATCKYKYLPNPEEGQLRHIVVAAPNIEAAAGKSSQLVGWDFTVQRRFVGLGGHTAWKDRYTSPEQTATTSDSTNATFSAMTVGVNVPDPPGTEDGGAEYRVMVDLLWHGSSQSKVTGEVVRRVDHYGITVSNGQSDEFDQSCAEYY